MKEDVKLTAIPYFLWNNRGEGEMKVWIPVEGLFFVTVCKG